MGRGTPESRQSPPAQRAGNGSAPRRALVAAAVGNLVEWYDLAVFGAFASVIAGTFFPGTDRTASLLAAFAVYSGAFVFRPVGAILFGRSGDRRGRRDVLTTVIVMMSLATAGIGVVPGYAAIGLLAPVLLVLCRSVQGLSVGGEAGGASAFVVEYASAGRRGLYGAWLWATVALGLGAGIGMAALLARLLPPGLVEAWGWRLAFLIALPLGLIGLYMRLRLDETAPFRAARDAGAIVRHPVRETVRAFPGRVAIGFALVAAASVTFNTFFVFLPNHLASTLGVPLEMALGAALLGLLTAAIVSPALGSLSDRVGRKPLLVAGSLGLLILIMPAYLLIQGGRPVSMALAYVLIGMALSCFVLPTFLSELFPTPVRATALAITYGLPTALAGGTAPFLATLLVLRTGNPVLPAWYAIAVTLAAAACALRVRETAFRPLDLDAG
jgi:MFS transporter, MHS family, proline/betaine transporter